MDEGVQIMGDSQDKIPEEVYQDLAEKWQKSIIENNMRGFLENPEQFLELKQGDIVSKVEELKLGDEEKEEDLTIALLAMRKALKGEGIARGFIPEGVSQLHISAQPEETKRIIQRIAENVTKSQSPKGRGR